MAMSGIQTTLRNNMCNALVDGIDVGSGDATGDCLVYTSAFGTLLATLLFSNPAFGNASSGAATASAITSGTAGNSGTAATIRIRDRDNATCFDGSAGQGTGDYNMNNSSVTSGDSVACTSFVVTQPAA
jgi:hypothetical protein